MPNYWIFQTTPENYDLPSALDKLDYDRWTIPDQYRNKVCRGDKVFFWKAGGKEGNSGIYAFGEITSEVGPYDELTETKPFVRSRGYLAKIPMKADVKYEKKYHKSPILRQEIKKHPILRKLQVITVGAGSVFPVREHEILELRKLISL